MLKKRVVITGTGSITPIGTSTKEFWRNLVSGKSGFSIISSFDCSNYPVKVGAEVKDFDPLKFMDIKRVDRTSLATQYGIAATRMALEEANLKMSEERPERVGCIIATSGGLHLLLNTGEVLKNKGPMRIDPLLLSKVAPSMVPAIIALEFGFKGPNSSVNSACASGNDALGTALNLIRNGHADVIFAGGTETQVNPLSIALCSRVGAMSRESDPEKACRPFDFNRSGMVFGDGAGILVLESLEHALKRNAPILAELAGAGWSFDAYNETAPDPQQELIAMQMAVQDAEISVDEIDYVNAHGTGTRFNDISETKALKMLLGKRAYDVPVSSNKSMIGHLACASGAIEAIAAVMTIKENLIPPTIHYETPDPDCDLNYVPNVAISKEVNVCLSNAFGMGGQNCCLIIKKYSS